VELTAFADQHCAVAPTSNWSISPVHKALSSKPATAVCGRKWWDSRTDRQTLDRCIDPAPHTTQVMPKLVPYIFFEAITTKDRNTANEVVASSSKGEMSMRDVRSSIHCHVHFAVCLWLGWHNVNRHRMPQAIRKCLDTWAQICTQTKSSAIAEGPHNASCQLKSCQLPHNSAETTCTTSPEASISCR